MGKAFGPRHITQRYIRRYGDTARALAWRGRLVHIRTENGVWRTNGQGYTASGAHDAWVLPFQDAVAQIAHCGPEKCGSFLLADGQPDVIV